jgi:hypothetical protein
MPNHLSNVDHSGFKVNQITIVVLSLVAFILNLWWLAGIVTLFMIVGTVFGFPGFGFLYRLILKPNGLVKPYVVADNPQPHRFAQGFGAVVLLAGTLAWYFGAILLGWVLVWLVVALAALNAFGGFCVGCFVYYQLGRLGIPGFSRPAPAGTLPGMRPKISATTK